jgi:predicted Fe-Mo cluster-binding NifX family protein
VLFAESGSKPAIRLGIFLKVESNHRIYAILLSGATGSRRNHKGFFVKIFISANGSTTDASVGQRLGLSPFFIIVNPQTMEFEAVPNSVADHKRAAGMQAVVLAVSKEVDMVLTGYCSPTAMKYLTDNGIEVITGVKGTISAAVAQYSNQIHPATIHSMVKPEGTGAVLIHAFKSTGKQFANLLPVFVGVILLMGLFNSFISKELLSSIFSGGTLLDTLWGAGFGSIFAGNPINSYVIGGELLIYGVSLFAVTAFITSWVTVGLVQLPAEIAALGKKFALVRNALSFITSIAIAILTVGTYNLIVGCGQ